jgi:hypothetical protein
LGKLGLYFEVGVIFWGRWGYILRNMELYFGEVGVIF